MAWEKSEVVSVDDIWISPRGTIYRIVEVGIHQATMRKGVHGEGRKSFKWLNSFDGWAVYKEAS
ncbi:hypothetical protein ACFL9S_11025 [Erwinia sp. AnSW2-5]|uniref:hypothetical protein n=1 Tax=Erwinia sp. AnSW2-5 TaxID=3367692 RepID=UPI0038600213